MEITLELLPSTRWAVKCGSRAGGGEATSAPGAELEDVLKNIVAPMVERAAASTVLQSPPPSVAPPSLDQLLPLGPAVKRRRVQIAERLPEILAEQREIAVALGDEGLRRQAAEAEQRELQERLAGGSTGRVR